MSGQTDTAVKMQASNIDEQGNVLYLDEERLKSKEMGFEPFKNSGKGLGIFDFSLHSKIFGSIAGNVRP